MHFTAWENNHAVKWWQFQAKKLFESKPWWIIAKCHLWLDPCIQTFRENFLKLAPGKHFDPNTIGDFPGVFSQHKFVRRDNSWKILQCYTGWKFSFSKKISSRTFLRTILWENYLCVKGFLKAKNKKQFPLVEKLKNSACSACTEHALHVKGFNNHWYYKTFVYFMKQSHTFRIIWQLKNVWKKIYILNTKCVFNWSLH